jgi:hypothetical protein
LCCCFNRSSDILEQYRADWQASQYQSWIWRSYSAQQMMQLGHDYDDVGVGGVVKWKEIPGSVS